MANFSASDIIGKTLIAKKDTPVFSTPTETGKPLIVIKKGQTIGIVYSYLAPNANRSKLYWMFESQANKKPYYVAHNIGNFDVKSLYDQGVKTTKEKQQEEEDKNKTTAEKISDTLKNFLYLGLGAYVVVNLGSAFIQTNGKRNR